jgi:hypothetical protein
VDGPPLFQETQSFRQNPWAVFAIVAALVACVAVLATLASEGPPLHPAGWLGLAVGGLVVLLLVVGGLETEVRSDGLYVRFLPLPRRHRFGWHEIVAAQARTYRPIREYGGWGIRFSPRGRAYNVHGDRGVQLELADGRRLLIGSQRADALAAAIAAARSEAR